MRLLHLADLHIGKDLYDFSLIDDQQYILERILDIVDEQKVDAVLMAGDIYDKSIPSEAAVRVLNNFLLQLAERKVKVCLISGNHDSDERLNFGSELLRVSGLYIGAKFEGKVQKETFEDEYGPVNIYLLPFVKASQVDKYFPDEKIGSDYEKAVRTVIAHAGVDPKQRNVILSHQFVVGEEAPRLGGSEGIAVQTVGLVEQIPYTCFDDFDYAALGHIHSPQSVGRENVRYSGSPLKYSLSEAENEKSVPLITMKEKGDLQVELLPLKPRRDLRKIEGNLETLVRTENVVDPDDYIYAVLTDEDVPENAMSTLRQYYPNTVKITFDNSHTREMDDVDLAGAQQDRPFGDLIRDFYRQVYGTEMNEEELALAMDAAKEAGIEV